jgi:hypothetical protein
MQVTVGVIQEQIAEIINGWEAVENHERWEKSIHNTAKGVLHKEESILVANVNVKVIPYIMHGTGE